MSEFIDNIKIDVARLVETTMDDTPNIVSDFIVIFPGRFQPFHKSHYSTYKNLVNKFGRDKVYIATSNKTDVNKSPFSFRDKKRIMVKMFGIPASKIIQVKNTYSPKEITSKFDPKKTAVITAIGEKDAARLMNGKYFTMHKKGTPMEGYRDRGYVFVSPAGNNDLSGTYVRSAIKTGTPKDKLNVLQTLYPKVDKSVFNLIIGTLSECISDGDILYFLENRNLNELLKESTTAQSAGAVLSVDDGPRYHYPNHSTFRKISDIRAAKIGYTVLDYIIKGADDGGEMAPDYPHGPVDATSFLPAGVAGVKTPMNQEDLVGSKGWKKWYAHVTRAASLVGYEVIKTKEEKARQDTQQKQSSAQSKSDQNVKFNRNSLSEETVNAIKVALNEFQSNDSMLEITYELSDDDRRTIEQLVDFTFEELNITKYPTIRLTNEREDISTTAYYNTQTHEIKIYTEKRALVDILRSVVHEIVHHQQNLEGRLVRNEDSEWAIGETDPWETEAHAMAGHIITKFKNISEKDIYLNENPDSVSASGTHFTHNDARAFGLHKNKMYVGKNNDIYHSNLAASYSYDKLITDREYESLPRGRSGWAYPGRLWTKRKVISFWKYPESKSKLKMVLKKIEKEANIKIIGAGWKLEIFPGKDEINNDTAYNTNAKIIDVGSYKGSKDATGIEKSHLKSPMKKKRKSVPVGVGARRRIPGQRRGESPAQARSRLGMNEDIILEGGAYGHMSHPFDDMDLTFGDLKILITNALQGKLEMTSEKTDGMNIMISWKNGKLIFARNGSHLKNFGKNALDINSLKSMFAGRGTIEEAFSTAADDLNSALSKLSEKQKTKIFDEGRMFMSLEVISLKNLNTIPYDSNMLIFHGSFEYDENGKIVGQSTTSGSLLSKMIKQINQNIQKTYNISGPPIVKLPQTNDFSKTQDKFLRKLSKLQNEFRLKDTDSVAMYHQSWWEQFIDKEAKKRNISLRNKDRMGLVRRWAFGDKSFRLNKKYISDMDVLNWAKKYDKNNHLGQFKKNILPFELLFLELGAQVLSNFKSVLIVNQDKAMESLKKELASAAKELRKTKDIAKLDKFKSALQKLRAIGGMNAIVPTEGLVFHYKGNIYKLTGSFANTHRILSLLKF